MADSSNVMNILKGLGTFDGSEPSGFREWSEKTSMPLSLKPPDIVLLLEGDARPTGGTTAGGTPAAAACDHSNYDIYAALFLLTKGSAGLLARVHKIARTASAGTVKTLRRP